MSTASGPSTLGYIGSKISLISNCEIRYEGILYSINTEESTVALQNVRTFGTEGRKVPEVPPGDEVYDFIVFRGKDIKDLTVCQAAKPVPDDPAIVAVNSAPPASQAPPPQHAQQVGLGGDMSQANGGHFGMGPRPDRGQYDRYTGMPRGVGPRPMMYGPPGSPTMGRGDYRKPDWERGNYSYMPRRGFGGFGGFGRGRPTGMGSRRIVGELSASPNQAVKNEVSEAFDFEGANAKFDKSTLKPELTAASGEGANNDKTDSQVPIVRLGYDKKTSFFDNISCETLDRQNGQETRIDRDKQRQLDSMTFGASATAALSRGTRFRRGYRRGVGGFRRGGRGGYGGGYGGGYYGGYGAGVPSAGGGYPSYPSRAPQSFAGRY